MSVVKRCYASLINMKKFNIEKALKTGTHCARGEARLGSIFLSTPSNSSSNGSVCKNESTDSSTQGALESGEESLQHQRFMTPMYLIHTQTGSIPHITPEVLKLIYPLPSSQADNTSPFPPLQISLDSTIKFADSLEKFGKGIGKFVGLPEVPTFITIHDALQTLKSGHNDKFGIALWSRHGRTSLTPERFTESLRGFKPSLCQILSDYDVRPESSGMKRLKKSLARVEEYSTFVIKEKNEGKFGQNTGLYITVETAWFEMNEELAKKTVAALLESQHHFEGFVIAGLTDFFAKDLPKSNASDKKQAVESSKVTVCDNVNIDLVEKIIKVLPTGLPKYVPGPFELSQMVDLISTGVDIFDTSITTNMAENAEVFLLDKVEAIISSLSTSLKRESKENNESLPERSMDDTTVDGENRIPCGADLPVISLKDKRFFDDFRPLSNECPCYTCRKHTRSYLHHLYATDELLGPVLLQIHNLTALDRFFQIIRAVLQDTDCPDSALEKLSTIKRLVSKTKVNMDLCDLVSDDNTDKCISVIS